MPEHIAASAASPIVNRSNHLQYVEVFGSSGQTWRFAAGTKAGFAVKRIRSKLSDDSNDVLCIAAFKDNEEPVEFGPDAELVLYGDNWKLKIVQDAGQKESSPTAAAASSPPHKSQHSTFRDSRDLIAEFYPGGKVPKGGKAEFTTEKRKRSRNWNIHEVLLLVQAKKEEWERSESNKSSKFESAVEKWVKVVDYLREKGIVDRDLDQCRGKWDNLLSDFKTIKEWHRSIKATPYASLSKEQKKQNKLPALFDPRVIELLESFYGTRPKLVSNSVVPVEDCSSGDHQAQLQHQQQQPQLTLSAASPISGHKKTKVSQ